MEHVFHKLNGAFMCMLSGTCIYIYATKERGSFFLFLKNTIGKETTVFDEI